MIHQLPKQNYNGLTIILSNPSRYDLDKKSLLTGPGGRYFEEDCLHPLGLSKLGSDIRLKEVKEPLLPATKALLILGESALHSTIPQTQDNTLGELRGSPLIDNNGCAAISSYLPQECTDIKNWEGILNPLLNNTENDDEDAEDTGLNALGEKRRHGLTLRKNWAFWLKKDCEKVKILLDNNGRVPLEQPKPIYKIYENATTIIQLLTTTKHSLLFFDLECDEHLNFTCFSFSFGLPYVYVVPVQRYNYTWAYNLLPQIFRALATGIRDNCLVAHNGANFDFFVLAYKYRIAIARAVKDTMIMCHRAYPEVEKSLGHATSLWTWQQYHKDEGNFGYHNREAEQSLWLYCGKDVYTMILIHNAIEKLCETRPGLKASIDQAHASIRPYLITTLMGIRYDDELRNKIISENDRYMMQLIRVSKILIGDETICKIRGSSKKPMMNSNTQCVRYFHDLLGYKTVATSSKTGKPSLGKKNLFKLKLKEENPMIDIAVAYRETQKETSALQFTPWKE